MRLIPLMYATQNKHMSRALVNKYIDVKAKSKVWMNNVVASGKYAQVTS